MSDSVKFNLNKVKEVAKNRPIGYYEDVIGSGTIIGDYVEIDRIKAIELVEKYQKYEAHPTTKEMIKNFGKAVTDEISSIATGNPPIDAETSKKRMEICNNCEFINKKSQRCNKCGCFLKWKTAWRSQKCPIGKW